MPSEDVFDFVVVVTGTAGGVLVSGEKAADMVPGAAPPEPAALP